MVKNNETGWEEMVPSYVDTIIKDNELFGSSQESQDSDEEKEKVPE
jgi:hypothetical protein